MSHRFEPMLCMYLSSCFCASFTLMSASSMLASILHARRVRRERKAQTRGESVSKGLCARVRGLPGVGPPGRLPHLVPLHLLALLSDQQGQLLKDGPELVDGRFDALNLLVP